MSGVGNYKPGSPNQPAETPTQQRCQHIKLLSNACWRVISTNRWKNLPIRTGHPSHYSTPTTFKMKIFGQLEFLLSLLPFTLIFRKTNYKQSFWRTLRTHRVTGRDLFKKNNKKKKSWNLTWGFDWAVIILLKLNFTGIPPQRWAKHNMILWLKPVCHQST